MSSRIFDCLPAQQIVPRQNPLGDACLHLEGGLPFDTLLAFVLVGAYLASGVNRSSNPAMVDEVYDC